MADQFTEAKVRAVLTTRQLLPKVQAALRLVPGISGPALVCEGDYMRDIDFPRNSPRDLFYILRNMTRKGFHASCPEPDPASIALLPFAKSTSGVPRGVKLTHRNLVANLCQMMHDQVNTALPHGKIIYTFISQR